jgi:hypothetical protein
MLLELQSFRPLPKFAREGSIDAPLQQSHHQEYHGQRICNRCIVDDLVS